MPEQKRKSAFHHSNQTPETFHQNKDISLHLNDFHCKAMERKWSCSLQEQSGDLGFAACSRLQCTSHFTPSLHFLAVNGKAEKDHQLGPFQHPGLTRPECEWKSPPLISQTKQTISRVGTQLCFLVLTWSSQGQVPAWEFKRNPREGTINHSIRAE